LASPLEKGCSALASSAQSRSRDRARRERPRRRHGSSALSRAARGAGGFKPGARAPDAPVVADGRETTLHRLLAYRRWTLLVPGSTGSRHLAALREIAAQVAAPIAVTSFEASDGGALQSLARKRLVLLVRPDRHVGLVARADDPGSLRTYLAVWLKEPVFAEARRVPAPWLESGAERA
jgi:hypothetical protein